MRRWVWFLIPAIVFRWYFFHMGKSYLTHKGERCLFQRLDEELIIIRYPTDGWYKKRGMSRPKAPLPEPPMIKGERLTNLRLRLALWIFPLVKHYADIDMKVKCRELALEEAETICREVSWRYGSVWQRSAEECAYFIRNRIDNSDKFRDELLRRRDGK